MKELQVEMFFFLFHPLGLGQKEEENSNFLP